MNSKFVLGLPRAKQLGLKHYKKHLRGCDQHLPGGSHNSATVVQGVVTWYSSEGYSAVQWGGKVQEVQ